MRPVSKCGIVPVQPDHPVGRGEEPDECRVFSLADGGDPPCGSEDQPRRIARPRETRYHGHRPARITAELEHAGDREGGVVRMWRDHDDVVRTAEPAPGGDGSHPTMA